VPQIRVAVIRDDPLRSRVVDIRRVDGVEDEFSHRISGVPLGWIVVSPERGAGSIEKRDDVLARGLVLAF
jgi:hypothetical protein